MTTRNKVGVAILLLVPVMLLAAMFSDLGWQAGLRVLKNMTPPLVAAMLVAFGLHLYFSDK